MKGSPRSIWLSWANRAASYWTSAVTAATRRHQSAILKAPTPGASNVKAPTPGASKPRSRSGKRKAT